MKKIWNEKQVYEAVLGAAYPSPPSTQVDYRNQVRSALYTSTGNMVSCLFEPEGLLLQAEEETYHMLHYPFKEHYLFTALNLLEQKARINLQLADAEYGYPAQEKIDLSTRNGLVNKILAMGGTIETPRPE